MAEIRGPSTPPSVSYTISVNGMPIAPGGPNFISFRAPYNRIDVTMTSTNCSLRYFEARVTKEGSEYGIGIGELAKFLTNVAYNTPTTFNFIANADLFREGDGVYRISLYARSAVDGSWDVYELLAVVGGGLFVPNDAGSTGFEVLTEREEP